jgi:hypothetical protein
MDEILRFLVNYEAWIYTILGVGGLINLRRVLQAVKEWRGASFGLEKENARYRFSISMTILLVFIVLAGIEFFLVSFLVPNRPQSTNLATPTLDLLATPTVTLPAGTRVAATPTGVSRTEVPVDQTGCTPGVVEWLYPTEGGELQGTVVLKGIINVPTIGFYKYEYSPVGSDTWVTIAAGNEKATKEPGHENELGGAWNTAQLPTGDYRLRLVVYDSQNNALPACEINIRIISP